MKTQGAVRGWGGILSWLTLVLAFGWVVAGVSAQDVRVLYRPLTPQDIKDFGLTNTTQKSGGAPNCGIGQPIYAEALVSTQTVSIVAGVTSRYATVVTSVNWSVAGAPPLSSAVMLPSPLSNAVPTFDAGDRIGFFVAGRAVLKPDVVSSFDFGTSTIQDYKILTVIGATNKTIAVTNSAYGAVYLGQKHYLCVLCHADKQTNFDATAHATAFADNITGVSSNHFSANCISCHVLGYDTTAGATNDGFDDIASAIGWTFPATSSPTNWTGMNTNLKSRANVQCENCHGPASTHMVSLGRTNAIDVSLSAGTCGVCHDSIPHHVKTFEWEQTMHATGYVFRFSGACMPCHSSKGFIETWDPFYVSSNKVPRSTEQEGIGCAACHDPHGVGMGEYQLRAITTATLSNGVVLTRAQAGDGVLCMNCHHARQRGDTYVTNTPGSNFGPHHSVQADMLAGENAIEYGLNMPSSRHMTAVSNSCVGCHMQLVAGTSFSNANTYVGGHTFRVSWEGPTASPTDDVHVTEICMNCHVENTFDIVGEDYDRDGTLEGVQTEIEGLLEQLALLLPPTGTGVTVTAGYTLAQRKAAYNYLFVEEDQSHGVHNPKYAAAILQASIDDLTGGIDVDRDGLLDSWEMANFGDLTSQTGADDFDGDGLSNQLEMQIGTNPKLADSDGDGQSDLAEMQGGSNPNSGASMLDTNLVMQMLPAIELGYMPSTLGVTQRFEYVNAMGDAGGWTNVGGNFISSNAFAYQLISLRDATQKYFRVIKP